MPVNLAKQTTKIRHQIQAGLYEQDLPHNVDEIDDIISALGYQAIAGKREYETFLKSLTTRLSQLDK